MQKKISSNILIVFSVCLLIFSTLLSGTANANTALKLPSYSLETDGFEILFESDRKVEYVYEENDEIYKVIATINFDKTSVHNDVYKKDENGIYQFVRTSDLNVTDNEATLTITEGEETKTFDVNSDKFSKKADLEAMISSGEFTPNSVTPNSNPPLDPWTYSFSMNYKENSKQLTIDAIASLLTLTYSYTWAIAIAAAALIRDLNTDSFWVHEDVYFKYIQGTMLARGQRSITNIYADKANNYFLHGPYVYDTYTPGWP